MQSLKERILLILKSIKLKIRLRYTLQFNKFYSQKRGLTQIISLPVQKSRLVEDTNQILVIIQDWDRVFQSHLSVKLQSTTKWSVPLSIFGLILTLIFSILSLRS